MKKSYILVLVLFSLFLSAYFLNRNAELKQEDKTFTLAEYNKRISRTDKKVLVYFYADWCMVCPKLKPIIEQVELENKDIVEVLKIDIDKNKEVKEEYEVDALPVLILYKGGKNIWTQVGLTDKKTIKSKIETL
jgi:thioredoxin